MDSRSLDEFKDEYLSSLTSLSIPLYGFCTITLYVHCGNFSHLHCMDSTPPPVGGSMYMVWGLVFKLFPLSPLIGSPMLWMGVSIVYCRTRIYG